MKISAAFLVAALLLFFPEAHGEDPFPVEFQVGKDVAPEKLPNIRQAKRIYKEACRWVERHAIQVPHKEIRPRLTVRIENEFPEELYGQGCTREAGACYDKEKSELWLTEWNAGAFTQAVLYARIEKLFEQEEILKAAEKIVILDLQTFADY